jgi:DNA gyrase subunit B
LSTGDLSNGQQQPAGYDAENITVLEGLEAVRKRPGMYIGSTGVRGLHHLVYEVVDNSVDEALAGYCDTVTVTIHPDDSVTVTDNGRGIPVATMEKEGKSALEVVMTVLHAGGKFGEGGGYKVSGGLHGVGVSVVNALSDEVNVTVRRDGYAWRQSYVRGAPQGPIVRGEETSETGTTTHFRPDSEVFETTSFDYSTLEQRLRETAFLTRGLRISITDERKVGSAEDGTTQAAKSAEFHYEGGIEDFVRYLNENKDKLQDKVIFFEGDSGEGAVEVAMQWNGTYQESVHSFANNINTHEGGSHLSGFRSALTRTINNYARKPPPGKTPILKEKDKNLEGDDIREGLTAVVSVKLTDPQFEGQTKTKLGNPGMQGFVESVVNARLNEFLEENPKEADRIIRKAVDASRARAAARKARDTARKSAMGGMGLPGKLADCMVKEPEIAELFIVEGDSAGGSAKQGRDRSTQAVLPLRGKILNVEKARIDKVLQNQEIQALITALGTGVREEFNLENLRYHKIILMTDADVDGAHIRTLILTLLFREMQDLVEAGHIYIAKPPLYRVTQGKSDRYIEKESELEALLLLDKLERFDVKDNEGRAFKLTDVRWQRYSRLLKQYEGWSSALRAEHGHEVVQFLEESQILDNQIRTPEELLELLARPVVETDPFLTELISADEALIRVKATERRSNLARTHRLRTSMFTANEFRQLARVHADLIKLAGTPPFTVALGQETEEATSFEELRRAVMNVAAKGVKLQRFKGLGEMNASQLAETTMDPTSRTLAQVTMDDAAAADRLFTMLMGDKVEPRREFIEENARVATLDV